MEGEVSAEESTRADEEEVEYCCAEFGEKEEVEELDELEQDDDDEEGAGAEDWCCWRF